MQGLILFGVVVLAGVIAMALFALYIMRKGPQVSPEAAEAAARYRAYHDAPNPLKSKAANDKERRKMWRRMALILGVCLVVVFAQRILSAI